MDNMLSFIGLMKKARALEVSVEHVTLAAESGKARLLCVAVDAAKNAVSAVKYASEDWQVPLITLDYTKTQLGEALGVKECAAVAVTDTGFALALCQKAEKPELEEILKQRLEREKKRGLKKTAAVAARKRRK